MRISQDLFAASFDVLDQSAIAARSGKARATSPASDATHFQLLERLLSCELLTEALGAALGFGFCHHRKAFTELEMPFKLTR